MAQMSKKPPKFYRRVLRWLGDRTPIEYMLTVLCAVIVACLIWA